MRPLVAHCHLGLGKVYLRTGAREQAQEHVATATTMYREMGMTHWLEQAELHSRSRRSAAFKVSTVVPVPVIPVALRCAAASSCSAAGNMPCHA